MINIHAVWDWEFENKLHIWAESFDAKKPIQENKFFSEKSNETTHPYSIGYNLLRKKINKWTEYKFKKNKNSDSLNLFLPSINYSLTHRVKDISNSEELESMPIPSLYKSNALKTELNGKLQLKPWTVSTISLSKEEILNFFYSLDKEFVQSMAKNSFKYYTELSMLATNLMIFQHILPSIKEFKNEKNNITYSTNWNLKLSSDVFNKVYLISQSMPYSFDATNNYDGSDRSFNIVLNFLNHSIDSYIKFNLLNKKIIPPRRGRCPNVLPIEERWFESLTNDDSLFVINEDEDTDSLISFKDYIDDLISIDLSSVFNIGFKIMPLEDTDNEGSKWLLNFYLQSIIDGSIIHANDIWDDGLKMNSYNLKHDDIKEHFLIELNRASYTYPILKNSLYDEYPTGCLLDTEDAYLFLSQYASSLKERGFSILLPSWWKKNKNRISMKLEIKSDGVGAGLMGMNAIIEYNWKIALGDDVISVDEFEKLVESKLPLIKIKDQWVELKQHEISSVSKFFKNKYKKNTMQLKDALLIGLGKVENEYGFLVTGVDGNGWVGNFLDKWTKNEEIIPIKVPDTFNGTLREYQKTGVSWLAFLKNFGFGACLADDMGLGKTIQLIALLLHERENNKSPILPTLIIGPMSILSNWQRELEKFAPSLNVLIHHGTDRLKGDSFEKQVEKYAVILTSYSLVHRDQDTLSKVKWGRIVLDEAQNIKNSSTKQTQAIKRLNSIDKIAMTGTPIENRLSELWSIMEFLNPGYLGNAKEFSKNFATPIEKYNDSVRAESLKQLIQPFVLRRLKTDKKVIKDLPDKMELKVFCNLTKEQASIYEAVVEDMLGKIESSEGIERKGLVLATLMKLKQICNHPTHFTKEPDGQLQNRSGKLIRLEEMIEESLSEGDSILIFTQFKEMGFILKKRLQDRFKCSISFLHGGTSKENRDIMIQKFQDNVAEKNIFILSLKAGGIGINLISANRVFHYDRWWNPAVEDQATDRSFRIGQKKTVQVHKFVCIGTVEERIDAMIEQKKDLADRIIHSGQDWITEMSTDKLKNLFKLDRNAVIL